MTPSFNPGYSGIIRDDPGMRLARGQQLILRCGGTDVARQDTPPEPVKEFEAGHSRDPSDIRLLIRLSTCETGSLETAPTATPSHRCSHYGMAQPSPLGFSLHSTRFQRSREGTPERRDASGARWRPRCGRIVSRAGFRGPGWAHVWPPGTPFPRKARRRIGPRHGPILSPSPSGVAPVRVASRGHPELSRIIPG